MFIIPLSPLRSLFSPVQISIWRSAPYQTPWSQHFFSETQSPPRAGYLQQYPPLLPRFLPAIQPPLQETALLVHLAHLQKDLDSAPIAFGEGSSFNLSFDYKAGGELLSTTWYDYMKVYLVPVGAAVLNATQEP